MNTELDTATMHAGAVVYRNVMVPMRDGVRLATDIYLPSDDGKTAKAGQFPLLLSRTPYSKQRPGQDGRRAPDEHHALRAAQRGFAVAIQDTRGRYQSEGEFRSMQDDGPDGCDTLAWLSRQTWCNGRIGMYGVSYLGATQMMLAPLRPPQLKAAFSEQPSSDEFTDRTFHSGALTLANVEGWAVNSSGEQYNERLPESLRARAEQELRQYRELGPNAFRLLPLEDVLWLRLVPSIWMDVLDHVEDPSFFAANDIRARLSEVNIPIYHLGGWFDPFLRNSLDHYKGASALSRARDDQRLIIGPWTHGGMRQSVAGRAEFPNAAFDDFGYAMAWHDRWLREAPPHPAQQHRVIIYVMGANRWRAEDAWPLPGTRVTSYFLRSGGRLSTEAPGIESPDTFRYDPNEPVPSPEMGPNSVTHLLKRDDMLVYTTQPLEQSIEVTGEITAALYAASSAQDTDWMLRLVDITPEGEAFHVVDGIMRARYRHSRTAPSALTPGRVEQYEINLWATSLVFERGHRIGLLVSSSNFPKYDRHPNVYADLRKITERDFVAAEQRIYHSGDAQSAVRLPIVNASEHQRWIANPQPLDAPLTREMPAPRERPPSELA